ncbi:DUF418 domain-containing protein [Aeromicrobium sp. YIM 150415]|uniref:DUF418 domain-containing protein n=1 Tax=Aeromicrobium sp. YIM 150415 TaxID=2803912 RepID=UPI0019640851|nr:DUF418 domain-containing protein [Aeromicrobium sp. YIM 150415]MBM9462910.1 DUF418 domain-containing protein [Aeromicrobium sp. YIM 150415]
MSSRWPLPDLARGVAIVAMLVAHAQVLVPDRPDWADELLSRVNDVASPLFALVMGISAGVMIQRSASRPRSVLVHNLVRGVVLIALGIWLETWGSWVAIVLAMLGCLLIIGTPLVLLGRRSVAVIALAFFVFSPLLNTAVQRAADWPGGYYADIANDPSLGDLLVRWFVADPHYRVTSLLPFFLVGSLLVSYARRPDPWWSAVSLIGGAGTQLVVTALRTRPGADTVSGSTLDLLHDASLVAVVLGLCGLAVRMRWARALRPIEEVGTVALSLYVLQIAVIAWLNRDDAIRATNDWGGFLIIVLGVGVAGWAWARWVGRGPIEWLTGVLTRRYRPTSHPL